jgi:hypothetical protein
MIRIAAQRYWSGPVLGLMALLLSGTSLDAQRVDPWRPGDESFEGYMAREPLAKAAEAVVHKFVDAAVAKNIPALIQSTSPTSLEANGQANVERSLTEAVVPFFADHKEFGRSTTIAAVRDTSGHAGFAFFMYSVRTNGEKKPFVVYVVPESGGWRVANVLLDRFIPGRHRPDEQ